MVNPEVIFERVMDWANNRLRVYVDGFASAISLLVGGSAISRTNPLPIGESNQHTLLNVCNTCAASGDNTLISAPAAGTRIVLVSVIIQNTTTTATTAIIKDGATAFARILAQNQGDGLSVSYPMDARKRLGDAAALVLNLSGANTFNYSVDYYTEAV